MKRQGKFLLSVALSAIGATGAAWAGDINGDVTDSAQVRTLPGAEIEIVELERTTQSGPDGAYRFTGVPAGTYTLRARYAAAQIFEQSVSVPQTGAIEVDIAFAGQGGDDEQILVIGQRASLASSISRQRASDTVVSVLTRDSIGQFPDQNVAESVRRAPGVNVLNDQGEGRFVSVRGLDPNLNSASVNGVRLPAPESDIRAVALDVIPSDLVESIEIQRSLTPDMDADTIGGSIEINTTSANDRREPLLVLRAEGSYNDLNEEWSPRYSVDYSRRFGRLGVAGGLSYNERSFSTDNIEADGWHEEGGVIRPEDLEYRDYDVERTRIGGSLSFDFDLDENTQLYVRGLHSIFEDQEYRGRFGLEFDDGAPGVGTATSASYNSADEDINFVRDMKDRYEEQIISSLVAGGETHLNEWTLSYSASWAQASEEERGSLDPIKFEREFDGSEDVMVDLDLSDWQMPMYAVSGADAGAVFDPTEFEFNELERTALSDAQDEETAFRFDVTREFALDRGDLDLSFGIRHRGREKTYDLNIDVLEYNGPGSITLNDFLGTPSYGLADVAPLPSQTAFRGFFGENPSFFERADFDSDLESLAGDYQFEENIDAAYFMGHYDRGPLRAIAGVRVERTRQSMSGMSIEADEDAETIVTTPVNFNRDYTHWLPSVNLRYEPVDDLVFRFAAYRSLMRPSPGQLAPRFIIEADGTDSDTLPEAAELGNPNLEPYEAWNYDATAEWYFGSNAVLSLGVFYKEIDNPIATVVDETENVLPAIGFAVEEAEYAINGESARVQGAEFGYAQAFTFLPGILGGLIASANYTYTDTEADFPTDPLGAARRTQLPAASEHTYNVTIGYDRGPFDIRFSASYRDGYLDELGGAEDQDRYVEDHIQYDVTARYDVNERFQIYTEFVNLGDEPYVAYNTVGGQQNLLQYEEYSWTGKVGVRARF